MIACHCTLCTLRFGRFLLVIHQFAPWKVKIIITNKNLFDTSSFCPKVIIAHIYQYVLLFLYRIMFLSLLCSMYIYCRYVNEKNQKGKSQAHRCYDFHTTWLDNERWEDNFPHSAQRQTAVPNHNIFLIIFGLSNKLWAEIYRQPTKSSYLSVIFFTCKS